MNNILFPTFFYMKKVFQITIFFFKKEEQEEAMDSKEDDTPKHKGITYKTYSPAVLKSNKKFKILNENELTSLMFQIGTTIMPPREKEDVRVCLFCHLRGMLISRIFILLFYQLQIFM